MESKKIKLAVPDLVAMPTEVLLMICEYLCPSDIIALRETCNRMLAVCEEFIHQTTIYVSHCKFPVDIAKTFSKSNCLPENIVFDGNVNFEFNHKPFLKKLGQHIKNMVIESSYQFDKVLAYLLENFVNLKSLRINLRNDAFCELENVFYNGKDDIQRVLKQISTFALTGDFDVDHHPLPIFKKFESIESFTWNPNIQIKPDLNYFLYVFGDFQVQNLRSLQLPRTERFNFFSEVIENPPSNLKSLSISLKNITEVMEVFKVVPELETLEISGYSNSVQPHFLDNVGNVLKNLESLKLSGHNLPLHDLSFLKEFDNLKSLSYECWDHNINYHVSHEINGIFKKLESFEIYYHNPKTYSYDSGRMLKPKQYLQGLHICSTCCEWIVTAFPNLQHLKLETQNVDGFQTIVEKLQLKTLHLSSLHNDIQDLSCNFQFQSSLECLKFEGFKVAQLSDMSNVQSMEFNCCIVADPIKNCSKLRKLQLLQCPSVDSSTLPQICDNLPDLKYLEIHNSLRKQASRKDLQPLNWDCVAKITYLRILKTQNYRIDSAALKKLFESNLSLSYFEALKVSVKRSEYERKCKEIC